MKRVFDYFYEISRIPRPSKHEEKVVVFLEGFAREHGLVYKTDAAGNVLLSKPASPGYESHSGVVLQAHMDMVCEAETDFDFLTQPIETVIEDNWVRAKGTTLGADDGIGMAIAMAALTDDTLEHGPLEALLTRDEETGLSGAKALKPGFFTGRYLINLDSEDEGEIFVGCAGGANTTIRFDYQQEDVPAGYTAIRLVVDKLAGGHSGDDINKGRANAIKAIARFLHQIWQRCDARLVDLRGGNLHNAIPRHAEAIISVPAEEKDRLLGEFNVFATEIKEEFHVQETEVVFRFESVETGDTAQHRAIEKSVAHALIWSLEAVHNGVLEVSQDIVGLVETSSNLANIRTNEHEIEIVTSQRSSTASALNYICRMIAATFELAGAIVETGDAYPGWKPNMKSELLRVAIECYKELFGKEPHVRAIHAGLECGLFTEKYPGLDMISIGPTLRGVHSPSESLYIPSVELVWRHLVSILKNIR